MWIFLSCLAVINECQIRVDAWQLLQRKSCFLHWGEILGEKSPIWLLRVLLLGYPDPIGQTDTMLVGKILPTRLFVEDRQAFPRQLDNTCTAWRRYYSTQGSACSGFSNKCCGLIQPMWPEKHSWFFLWWDCIHWWQPDFLPGSEYIFMRWA